MPPTGGLGIGIGSCGHVINQCSSIRDVLFFSFKIGLISYFKQTLVIINKNFRIYYDIVKRFIIAVLILGSALWVLASKPFNLGLDLKGGVSVKGRRKKDDRQITNEDMLGVIDVIRGRINALGLTEPVIQRKGLTQVIVELPGISDIDRALALIGETAQLTFHEAEWALKTFKSSLRKKRIFYSEKMRRLFI